MTAHILFPKIDQFYPATLSTKLLHDILRTELHYEGIIVSDDLDMKAVSKGFKDEDNVAQAINAGCDMFIIARHPDPASDRPLMITNYLHRCLKKRAIKEDRLYESFERIRSLFQDKLKDYPVEVLSQDVLEEHAELARSF